MTGYAILIPMTVKVYCRDKTVLEMRSVSSLSLVDVRSDECDDVCYRIVNAGQQVLIPYNEVQSIETLTSPMIFRGDDEVVYEIQEEDEEVYD